MSKITVDQLETVLAICRLGSFRAAADQLGVTQPAVSLRVRQLEQICGAPLFARRGARVQPTAAGLLARGQAERALGAVAELEARVRADDPWHGLLRLGSSDLFAMTCLPQVLGALEHGHPGLEVNLVSSSSAALTRALERRELDAAFLANPSPAAAATTSTMIAQTPLALVSNGRLGLPDSLAPGDLRAGRLLVNPPPSVIHVETLQWFRRAGVPPPTLSTCNSLPVTVELVHAGGGAGIVPLQLVRSLLDDGALRRHMTRPALGALRLYLVHVPGTPRPILDFLLGAAIDAVRAAGYSRRGTGTPRS